MVGPKLGERRDCEGQDLRQRRAAEIPGLDGQGVSGARDSEPSGDPRRTGHFVISLGLHRILALIRGIVVTLEKIIKVWTADTHPAAKVSRNFLLSAN